MPKSTAAPRRRITPAVNIKKLRQQRAEAREQNEAAAAGVIELTLAEHKGRLRGEGRHGDGSKKVVVPETKEFGNVRGDREWFAAAQEAGFIELVGADEPEVPSGATWRYTGPMVASARFWKWPSDGTRCDARSYIRDEAGHYILGAGNFQLKRPCTKPPIRGGNVCIPHGGGIERVRRAAEMRLLGAADVVIGALIEIALNMKADEKARVQAINSVLDRAQIKGVTQVEVDIPAYREVIKNAFPAWGADGEEEEEDD